MFIQRQKLEIYTIVLITIQNISYCVSIGMLQEFLPGLDTIYLHAKHVRYQNQNIQFSLTIFLTEASQQQQKD